MTRTYFVLIVFLLFVFIVRLSMFSSEQKEYPDGKNVRVTARLTMSPEAKGRSQSFTLRPKNYDPIYISAPLYPEYTYGQILTVSGKVNLSEGEKKFASMQYPTITVRENDSLLYGLMGYVRDKVSSIYSSALPGTGASLLMGIVFGIKQGMPESFKDALAETGVTHVIAASGMNVTLVAGVFMVIFGTFLRRQIALILSIGGVFSYAFLAGMEPSILRASIMGTIVFIAGILGKQNVALWTLLVTCYLMLFANPHLVSDVGFQLSFLATLGILIVKPALYDSQTREDGVNDNVFSEDLRTTVAAQLGTVPVLLGAFGQVSFLSILVNMLVLWMIPMLMFIGAISALSGLVYEPLGRWLAFFALPFLIYFEAVVTFFASFHWKFTVESFPWQAAVLYYLLLGLFVWWRKRRGNDKGNRGETE